MRTLPGSGGQPGLPGDLDPILADTPRDIFERRQIVVAEKLKNAGIAGEGFPALLVESLSLPPVLQDCPQLDSDLGDLSGGVF